MTKASKIAVGVIFIIAILYGVDALYRQYQELQTWRAQATSLINQHTQAFETVITAYNELNQKVNALQQKVDSLPPPK